MIAISFLFYVMIKLELEDLDWNFFVLVHTVFGFKWHFTCPFTIRIERTNEIKNWSISGGYYAGEFIICG